MKQQRPKMIDFKNPCVIEAVKRIRIKKSSCLSRYTSISIDDAKLAYENNEPEVYWKLLKEIDNVHNEAAERDEVRIHKSKYEKGLNMQLEYYKNHVESLKALKK